MDRAVLRRRVLHSLRDQGFRLRHGLIAPPDIQDKDQLRSLHAQAVKARIERAAPGLRRFEDRLLSFIAHGCDVDPGAISPRLVTVQPDTESELLFRYARLHWNVPVSAGYGRRLRFLVMDQSNQKLIGIIGLGDPVGALRPRDEWIGWSREARLKRLQHVLDAFVLGAVPPYSQLLCGKLVALLAATNEVRRVFRRKYAKARSIIRRRRHDARLALMTTASAFGRSSMYNRLRHGGETVYISAGYTRGSGEFQFSNGVYSAIMDYALEHCEPTAKHARWGNGFRNRREIVRKTLHAIGLSRELVYHGIQREMFVVPMARNTREFLRGNQDRLMYYDRSVNEVASAFRERWLLPRATRDESFRSFDASTYRLWTDS